MPTGGSTDLWNSDTTDLNCTNTIRTLNPTYLPVFQAVPLAARTGTFYIGLYTTFTSSRRNFQVYREYIQVRLKQPLIVGKVYYAQMYAAPPYASLTFANNLGIYFSTNPTLDNQEYPNDGAPILAQPQVNDTTIISGPGAWHKVWGFFVADKPYEYLTIGNFFDDAHTNRTNFNEQIKPYYGGFASYYLIDDVSVHDTGLDRLPTAPNLGRDTTLCAGQSVRVSLPAVFNTSYRWQDGSTVLNRAINQTGTYYVTATTGGYSITDTLHVRVEPPIRLPVDTVLCRGETITLKPTYATTSFVWNDGSQDSTLTVSQAGQYWVQVPSARCAIRDTINVQVLDCPGEIPNVFTPNGDGKNDAFQIANIELIPWRLEIYNRWGRRVYESDAYRNDWRGEGLPSGVYYYGLSNAQTKRQLKGWVQIIR